MKVQLCAKNQKKKTQTVKAVRPYQLCAKNQEKTQTVKGVGPCMVILDQKGQIWTKKVQIMALLEFSWTVHLLFLKEYVKSSS